MTIRLLLVFLILIGAGSFVGQHVFLAQATDVVAEDQEDPQPPVPEDPDPPMPEEPEEEPADDDSGDDDSGDDEPPTEEPGEEDETQSPEMTDDVSADEMDAETPDSPETDRPEMDEDPQPEMEPAEPVVDQIKDAEDGDAVAIRQTVASFVEAFNRGDAESLAMHWTEQGDFVTAAGERWQGRRQIEDHYAAYFAVVEDARLELEETRIEVQSPSVAIETGIARVLVPGQMPMETAYKAIHVKTPEGWKIDSVREYEMPPPPGRDEMLAQLEWMVGQWVDQAEDAEIKTTCRWATNRSFLVQTFRVFVEDRIDFEGTQIIGWDPRAETIRSWTFDSEGGFGAGRWSGSDGRWTVHTLQVLPDGRIGSATNIYERIDDNTVSYRSVGRQVDGKILPNIDPVSIVRTTEE